MMTYVNRRLKKAGLSYAYAAVVTSLIFGGVTAALWIAYTKDPIKPTNTPLWFLILLSCVVIIMIGTFGYAACVICSEVQADEVGLKIKTCLFGQRFVPWDDVKGITSWTHKSRFNPKGDMTFVEVRQGISPLHYSLVRDMNRQIRWALGFTLMASGQNYGNLVRQISEKSNVSPVSENE